MQKYEIGGKVFVVNQQVEVTDTFKLGDPVRVLVKDYSSTWKAHTGVIIAIDQFLKRPAVTVCYIESSYNSPELKFKTLTGDEKEECDITMLGDVDESLTVSTILDTFDARLKAKENELESMRLQRAGLASALEKITKK